MHVCMMQWICDGRRVAVNIDSSVKIFDVQHHRFVAAAPRVFRVSCKLTLFPPQRGAGSIS